MIRRTVLFCGRVQGVGFRYTTCDVARGFEVTGYVRNLPDGQVEAVAEGENDEVAKFVEAISAEMGRYIRDARWHDSPATGEFNRFEIRL
jgi:acylphosphatase